MSQVTFSTLSNIKLSNYTLFDSCACVYVCELLFQVTYRSNLCSKVMAGGQVFEPKEAVPVAGSASAGIMLNHLESMQTSV